MKGRLGLDSTVPVAQQAGWCLPKEKWRCTEGRQTILTVTREEALSAEAQGEKMRGKTRAQIKGMWGVQPAAWV